MRLDEYKNILVALDVFAEYEAVIARGIKMAGEGSTVSLVHVLTPEAVYAPYGAIFPTDLLGQIREQADNKLKTIANVNGVNPENIHLPVGRPADEIQNLAQKLDADLIVIGTHGRSGFGLLLGSTANAVLHGVKRDVLSVRIK